jgi:hypothetical protein
MDLLHLRIPEAVVGVVRAAHQMAATAVQVLSLFPTREHKCFPVEQLQPQAETLSIRLLRQAPWRLAMAFPICLLLAAVRLLRV